MNDESKTISIWIDSIIEDIVNSQIKLSDTLIKTQVLAFKIKNEKFSEWLNDELNGYVDKVRPLYRCISAVVLGNLIVDAGFRGVVTRKNYPLPIELLGDDIKENLYIASLDAKVSELEVLAATEGTLRVFLPHSLGALLDIHITPWHVDTSWQSISQTSIIGILTTIKSTLLNFLLNLNKEFGNNNDLSIMKKKKEIDSLFEKTIGSVSGNHVNITVGTGNTQGIIIGNNATQNNATGQDIHQSVNINVYEETKKFIDLLQSHLPNLQLDSNDVEDVNLEITRINTQLERSTPKNSIISGALNTINGILIGVAGNVATPVVMNSLQKLINYF